MQQDGGTRVQQVLVDTTQDVDVVLRPDGRRHDSMVIVDKFLEVADTERRSTNLLQLFTFLLVMFLVRLEDFVVTDELCLHQEVVLHPFQLEESQFAFRIRRDRRRFVDTGGTLTTTATALTVGRTGFETLLFLLLFTIGVVLVLVAVVAGGRTALPHVRWHVSHDCKISITTEGCLCCWFLVRYYYSICKAARTEQANCPLGWSTTK
mmetsp:Transcript_1759/g.4047  ORF Transcript_1759/g.4047 Transcript_1759/m.4047 type:complete len:208 (-) Transcript_1759:45-668(-)